MNDNLNIPVGTKALIFSKLYYGVLSKNLEGLDIERYYSILYFLQTNNGCSQQCICNNLAIDKTAMVKVMDYLIAADYVRRKVNPDDRREHFVMLTKKGMKRTDEIVKSFNTIDKELFSNVAKEDKEIFLSTLNALSLKLEEMPGNDLFFNYRKTAKKNLTKKTKVRNEKNS
jgi:DNA-binding MarR family transcriptional regulator